VKNRRYRCAKRAVTAIGGCPFFLQLLGNYFVIVFTFVHSIIQLNNSLMKNQISAFLLLTLALSVMSCASSYRPIQPERMPYTNLTSNGDVALGYRYDVLRETRNKKYAKKELKNGVKVVAVSVTNNSVKPLIFGTDLKLMSGERELLAMSPTSSFNALKQNTPIYLLYGLLTFVKLRTEKRTNNYIEIKEYPVGLVIGPAVTIGNVAVSAGANKKFKSELITRDLWGKVIEPGKTVYGLVSIGSSGYDALSIKLVGSN
jgi:hypothetical protein